MHVVPLDDGDRRGRRRARRKSRAVVTTGETGRTRPGFAMLSVPTLWTVFIINFLALGLIWAYVMRCYPSFEASRFWTGSAFVAAAGAAMAMLRVVFPDSLVPLLCGGTALLLAICLAAMGVRKFFDRPVSWRDTVLTTGLGFAGLSFFIFVYDSVLARLTVFTIAQALPMVLSLK